MRSGSAAVAEETSPSSEIESLDDVSFSVQKVFLTACSLTDSSRLWVCARLCFHSSSSQFPLPDSYNTSRTQASERGALLVGSLGLIASSFTSDQTEVER